MALHAACNVISAVAWLHPLPPQQVLENGEGGLVGTLLAAVDNCVTPAGRRRLRQWLCRPLFHASEIEARQGAVHDLMTVAEEAAGKARKLFGGGGEDGRLKAYILFNVVCVCVEGGA